MLVERCLHDAAAARPIRSTRRTDGGKGSLERGMAVASPRDKAATGGEGEVLGRCRTCAWAACLAVMVAVGATGADAGHARRRPARPAGCVAEVRNVRVPRYSLVVEARSELVYTRPGARPPQVVVGGRGFARWGCHAVIHELGHAFDATLLTPAERTFFETDVLRERGPWSAARSDAPVEKFAEVYYLCATGKAPAEAAREVRLRLSRRELRVACGFLRTIGPVR